MQLEAHKGQAWRNYPTAPPIDPLSFGVNWCAIFAGSSYGTQRSKRNPSVDASGYGQQKLVS